jgi:hypothetical protein
LPGKDHWVAVTDEHNSNGRDWVEIGNSNHPGGTSHVQNIGAYPIWGDNVNAVKNSTWNYYVMWIPINVNTMNISMNATKNNSTFLEQCKQECNKLDDCNGFVYNTSENACYLKNMEMYPKGLRKEDSMYELYSRNKSVKNNMSCNKTVEPTSSMMWELFPIGDKMSMDTLCNLGIVTEQDKRDLEIKNANLRDIAGVVETKVQDLSKQQYNLNNRMNMSKSKFNADLNSYENIRTEKNNYSEDSSNMVNINAMLEDSDLNMISNNYKNLIWTHLALLLLIGVVVSSRNT